MSKLQKNIRNYTTVANDIINDDRLSLKAKGLYLYLVSKPDNWNFSARLIATQNKDSRDSIISGLHELESVGLLLRVACQGGYDYQIFDVIKIHSTENPQSGKSVTTKRKIHSVEKPFNISNKELQVKREERENINLPYLDQFLDFVVRSEKPRSPLAFKNALLNSLNDPFHSKHLETMRTYENFAMSVCGGNVSVIDPSKNIFDLIGRD